MYLHQLKKQHQKFPLLDEAQDMEGKTLFTRADQMLGPNGIIGAPIVGIEDIIRRKHKNVLFLKCEELADDPKQVMENLYKFLELKNYKHNFDNVKNTATDPDGFYLWKYPHEGDGKVKPLNKDEWKKYISDDLAETIMDRFQFYNKVFKYK